MAFFVLFLMTFGQAAHACPKGQDAAAAVAVELPLAPEARVVATSAPSLPGIENDICCAGALHCGSVCASASCSAALPASTSSFDRDGKACDNGPLNGTTLTLAISDIDFPPPRLF
jgi:hypothetical protein